MKYAILAAGEGERLLKEGINMPKPLVKIQGEAMIDRLIRIFIANGADEVWVIANETFPQLTGHLHDLQQRYGRTLKFITAHTPGSMHSFHALAPYLGTDRFCLTTVDPVFSEKEFTHYIQAFQAADADAWMAVTRYVEDEKPLHVDVDEETWRIRQFLDDMEEAVYVSGGIYCLDPVCLHTLERCMREGRLRMRDFQRGLIEDGLCVKAFPFSKIVDVDHARDIVQAELWLQEEAL